jgi:tubulin-folding cofactor B
MASTLTTARDVPLLITSTASSSERRITPSWTIAHLKTKLEPVTGIAPSSQKLTLRLPDQQQEVPIEADDEETVEIGTWSLVPYAEIKVRIL